jgi:hypothetical protein
MIRSSLLLLVASALLLWSTPAQAQHYRGRIHVGIGFGYYSPFFWGGYGWYPSPWFHPPYPYYAFAQRAESAARLLVTPRETEVYLDGYLVGTVDDFDGFAQRLRVRPGEHQIQLYLEGHRTITETLLFRPGETYKISHVMEPLPEGEAPSSLSESTPSFEYREPRRAPATMFGTLAVRVQPADAEIYIDGERWESPSEADRLVVEVTEGRHRVEVRKDGFQTYAADVDVRRGRVTTINVSLLTQDVEV